MKCSEDNLGASMDKADGYKRRRAVMGCGPRDALREMRCTGCAARDAFHDAVQYTAYLKYLEQARNGTCKPGMVPI